MKILYSLILMTFSLCNVYAQVSSKHKPYQLKDVRKFEFTVTEGGLTNSYDKFEVELDEHKIWQTWKSKIEFSTGSLTPAPARKLVKAIQGNRLVQLLQDLSNPDTTKNPNWFRIDKDTLSRYIDSINMNFLPSKKVSFNRDINNPELLKSALQRSLVPNHFDDKTTYQIKSILLSGDTVKAYATSFADIYDLPWNVEGKKLYNPNITRNFIYLTGDERSEWRLRSQFYKSLFRAIARLQRL